MRLPLLIKFKIILPHFNPHPYINNLALIIFLGLLFKPEINPLDNFF